MISKRYISDNLQELDDNYKKAGSKEALYFSKLAILELCGWIEESMDDVILRSAKKRLKVQKNIDYIEDKVIDKTFAFDYEKFRFMLIRLVGMVNVEKIEDRVDPVIFARFTGTLGALRKSRNTEAHTHLKGTASSINAPSITTRSHFINTYA